MQVLKSYETLAGGLGGEDYERLDRLAVSSTIIVSGLGEFLLLNEKTQDFERALKELRDILPYFDRDEHLLENLKWHQELLVRWMAYSELTGYRRETPEIAGEIMERVKEVEEAEDVEKVEDSINYLRDSFYRINRISRSCKRRNKESLFYA